MLDSDDLGNAYLFSIIFFVVGLFIGYLPLLSSLLFAIIQIVVVGRYLKKDADARKLSGPHMLWAFLGILGVLVYHFFIASKNKINKTD